MGGLSRNDFFRVVLPGGMVLFLIDIALRILGTVEGIPGRSFAGAQAFIETPLNAAALVFGAGMFMYFVDPGYGAPQYYANIPSTHLRRRLAERDIETDAVSLYLVVADSMVPPALQERALFYGAVYRIGFQLVYFSLLTAALVPLIALWQIQGSTNYALAPTSDGLLAVALMVSLAVIPWAKTLLRRTNPDPFRRRSSLVGRWFAFIMTAVAALPLGAWIWTTHAASPSWSRPLAKGVTVLVLLVWSVLRLGGPLRPRLEYLRGLRRSKPDQPHGSLQVALVDLLAVSPAISGLVVLGPRLSIAATWTIAGLSGSGLLLAFFRKHERQQYGIYRNQNLWLDANLDRVIDEFHLGQRGPTVAVSEPVTGENQGRSAGWMRPAIFGAFALLAARGLRRRRTRPVSGR